MLSVREAMKASVLCDSVIQAFHGQASLSKIAWKINLVAEIELNDFKKGNHCWLSNCFHNPTSMDHFIAALMMTVILSTKPTVVSTVYRYVVVNEIKKRNPVLIFNHKTWKKPKLQCRASPVNHKFLESILKLACTTRCWLGSCHTCEPVGSALGSYRYIRCDFDYLEFRIIFILRWKSQPVIQHSRTISSAPSEQRVCPWSTELNPTFVASGQAVHVKAEPHRHQMNTFLKLYSSLCPQSLLRWHYYFR